MWREACAVLLISATAYSQNQVPEAQAVVAAPKYQTRQVFKELRRGSSEDVAVVLLVPGEWVASPRSPVAGITPATLELEDSPGFTVSKVRYPKPSKPKAVTLPVAGPLAPAGWYPVSFKLSAARDVSLGEHLLRGKISYQTVTKAGVAQPQELQVAIPITVVDHDVTVHKDIWIPQGLNAVEITLIVIVAIILLPVIIPVGIACATVLQGKCD